MDKNVNTKKIRNEKDIVMEESSRSRLNNSRKRRLNNKKWCRNKSSSNSSMEVDLPKPSKQYDANNGDAISELESEYISFSQSQKCWKFKSEKKKYINLMKEDNLKLIQIK